MEVAGASADQHSGQVAAAEAAEPPSTARARSRSARPAPSDRARPCRPARSGAAGRWRWLAGHQEERLAETAGDRAAQRQLSEHALRGLRRRPRRRARADCAVECRPRIRGLHAEVVPGGDHVDRRRRRREQLVGLAMSPWRRSTRIAGGGPLRGRGGAVAPASFVEPAAHELVLDAPLLVGRERLGAAAGRRPALASAIACRGTTLPRRAGGSCACAPRPRRVGGRSWVAGVSSWPAYGGPGVVEQRRSRPRSAARSAHRAPCGWWSGRRARSGRSTSGPLPARRSRRPSAWARGRRRRGCAGSRVLAHPAMWDDPTRVFSPARHVDHALGIDDSRRSRS